MVVLPMFFVACGSAELHVLVPELPDEVDFVTVLFEAADQRIIGSTGLISPAEALGLDLDLDLAAVDRARVFAYHREELEAAVSLPPDEVLKNSRARLAGVDEARLPRSAHYALGPRSGSQIVADPAMEAEPDLTVDWLPPCPELVPAMEGYLLDLHCPPPCSAVIRQQGCRLQVEPRGCAAAAGTADVDSRGRFHLDQIGSTCEPSLTEPERFNCTISDQVCELRFLPSESELGDPILSMREGEATMGMAVLDDRVVLGLGVGGDREDCTRAGSWEVEAIDLETLEALDTTTIADCTTALGPHPSTGYLLASGPPGDQRLVHRNASGQILDEVVIPQPGPYPLVVSKILPLGSLVALEMSAKVETDRYTSWAVVVDLERPGMSRVLRGPLERGATWFFASAEDRLLITEDGPTNLTILDPQTGDFEFFSISSLCTVFDLNLTSLMEWAPGRISIGVGKSGRSGLVTLDRMGDGYECRFAPSLEGGSGGATGRVPNEPTRQLVGLLEPADGSATVGVFDRALDRFLVGRRSTGGRGRLGEIALDRKGRAWLRYAESGDLVRLDGFAP